MRTVLLCPFTAGTVLWQAQDGAWTLTVAVRGTFSLVHGREALLADFQEAIAGDRHLGDDPRASLWAPSEIIPYKQRADVILVGSAFAPDKRPVDALVARLAVGDIDKSIGVVGDRVWLEGPDGLEPSQPHPFVSMPLEYERAARAPDNPVGFDLTRAPAAGALALPNLEAADDEIGAARTVGFGPVLPFASTRRALLQGEAWAWAEAGRVAAVTEPGRAGGQRFAQGPLPQGFDFGFYNAAPRDQQLDALGPSATVVLENLHREHPRLEVKIPGVRPKAFIVSSDLERGVEVELRCDTLWIDADRAILSLTWRGVTRASAGAIDEDAIGMLVVAAEPPGREIHYRHIEKILREGTSVSLDEDTFSGTPAGIAHDFKGAREPFPTLVEGPRFEPSPVDGPASGVWDELSSSDLVDIPSGDERTITRATIKLAGEDTFTEPFDARRFVAQAEALAIDAAPPERADARPRMEVSDYARVAVAIERGEAARALAGYGVALAELPELQRAWSLRLSMDPALAAAFAAAVESERRS